MYETEKRHLFHNFVKQSDTKPPHLLIYKFCNRINNLQNNYDYENWENIVIIESTFNKIYQNIDLTLLNRLLRLIIDETWTDYIISKNNVNISFKDIWDNSYRFIQSLQFNSFVTQYYWLLLDILIIWPNRTLEISWTIDKPNDYLICNDKEIEIT